MLVEALLRVVEVGVTLLQAACWPALILLVLLYFGPSLRAMLQNATEMNIVAGGVELQMKLEAAAALGAAQASRAGTEEGSVEEPDATAIAQVVDKTADPSALKRFAQAQILWVDDVPSNNWYERRTLEALGMHSLVATSTEEALDKLAREEVDVVVSDMGRGTDERAGYTLLEQMRERGYHQPFVVYSSSNLPEHRVEARERGALGSTNNPRELFQLVTGAILGNRSA